MTHFERSLPPFVTTACPTAHVPIRSHSSWMVGPPRWRIAPATPDPSCSASLAGLTIASTLSAVMSVFAISIVAAMRGRSALHGADDGVRDREIRLRHGRARLRDDDRPALVAADRDLRIERNLSQEGHAELLRRARSPAVLEDLLAVPALRADVVGHVLDDAEHRHVDLLEHREALARVDERHVLGSRHD